MKSAFLVLLLSAVAAAADPQLSTGPLPRPHLTPDQLRQGTSVVPLPTREIAFRELGDNPANRVPLRGTQTDHGIQRDPDGPSPASRPFDWADGGTYFKKYGSLVTTEGALQFDGPNGGWDLLKLSWW
jgi:hypothetical protein